MAHCPVCSKALETIRQREGVFHLCPDCHGRTLSIPQLRRAAGDAFAVKLLRLLKLAKLRSNRECPFCSQRMSVITPSEPAMDLEACAACSIVWFDEADYVLAPEGAAESTGTLSMLATEILAAARLKEEKERAEKERQEEQKKKRLRESLKNIWNQGKEG